MDLRWLSPSGLQALTSEENQLFGRRALVLGASLALPGAAVLGYAHSERGALPLAVVYGGAAAAVIGFLYVMRGLERLVLGRPSGETGDAGVRVVFNVVLRVTFVLVVCAALAVVRETPR